MVKSPSWEANWFAASQEILRISRNPKVHYRTQKRPPPVSILGQPNPVHIPTSHLLEIHPNIIHPSMPRSPQWSSSLRFPQQESIHPPLLTHTHHIRSPSIKTSLQHEINMLLFQLYLYYLKNSYHAAWWHCALKHHLSYFLPSKYVHVINVIKIMTKKEELSGSSTMGNPLWDEETSLIRVTEYTVIGSKIAAELAKKGKNLLSASRGMILLT